MRNQYKLLQEKYDIINDARVSEANNVDPELIAYQKWKETWINSALEKASPILKKFLTDSNAKKDYWGMSVKLNMRLLPIDRAINSLFKTFPLEDQKEIGDYIHEFIVGTEWVKYGITSALEAYRELLIDYIDKVYGKPLIDRLRIKELNKDNPGIEMDI